MSTAIREQLEREAAGLRAYADQLDAKGTAPNTEEQEQLVRRANEIKNLKKAYDASKEATEALGDVSTFLKDLGDAPAGTIKSLADVERTPDGRIANPVGKTLGELFTESAQFKALDGYKGSDGIISAHTSHFKTPPFHVDMKDLITGSSATSAGAGVRNDWFSPLTDLVGDRELRVADLVTKSTTQSDAVDYVRVTARTNSAAMAAETTHVTSSAVKPESSMTFEVVTANVRTIAHWIPITRRAASDAGQIRTYVDQFLRYGVEEELDDQMLTGAGTGEQFTGILNVSGIGSTDGTTGGGASVDSVLTAIAAVRYTGFRRPTAFVVHPNDWYSTSFLLKKDGESRYLIGDPRSSADQMNMLWGLQVVVTPAITEGVGLVGDFRQAILWQREGIQLYVTDSHSDFFTRNILVLLAEMRAAFGVLDPQAFCKITNL